MSARADGALTFGLASPLALLSLLPLRRIAPGQPHHHAE